jgi:hypothetical protein
LNAFFWSFIGVWKRWLNYIFNSASLKMYFGQRFHTPNETSKECIQFLIEHTIVHLLFYLFLSQSQIWNFSGAQKGVKISTSQFIIDHWSYTNTFFRLSFVGTDSSYLLFNVLNSLISRNSNVVQRMVPIRCFTIQQNLTECTYFLLHELKSWTWFFLRIHTLNMDIYGGSEGRNW